MNATSSLRPPDDGLRRVDPAQSLPGSRLLLLLGAPRSGTSWSGKVFDSHPRVLYRHEPDISLRSECLPSIPARADFQRLSGLARAYVAKLAEVRTIKSVGSRPSFPKDYGSALRRPVRDTLIGVLRVLEFVPPVRPVVGRIEVPDMLGPAGRADVHVVIKSVSSGTRARLFAEALPEARLIFLMRHPGGQVASMLRGAKLGKFAVNGTPRDLLESAAGRHYGLSPERHAALPLLDQLVWNWVLFNETIMNDLAGVPTARIARHNDLVADPVGGFSGLFAFAGLDWTEQTDTFIQSSTRPARRVGGYYSVHRNSAETLDAWRRELSDAQRARVSAILRETAIAARWPDLAE